MKTAPRAEDVLCADETPTTNRHRSWAKGNHPGYNLVTRLRDKAEQVFTFTRRLAVPWTNNSAEQALKGPKRHQAVSGYWHTPTTLADYCRSRSYLLSARNHDLRPSTPSTPPSPATPGSPQSHRRDISAQPLNGRQEIPQKGRTLAESKSAK